MDEKEKQEFAEDMAVLFSAMKAGGDIEQMKREMTK